MQKNVATANDPSHYQTEHSVWRGSAAGRGRRSACARRPCGGHAEDWQQNSCTTPSERVAMVARLLMCTAASVRGAGARETFYQTGATVDCGRYHEGGTDGSSL